ncbi:restriction endonuclease subunit S [Massilia sp. W12]|uniref:restriction endonuclease subunit S n=1 Tax=Massilia sp. W12 TaxID=3126507 RepID=UPI0030CA8048
MDILSEYAEVRAGHPFRGSVPEIADGCALTVQMRDVNPLHGVAWAQVARTNPGGRKKPDWLRDGDILFLARGARNFAVHLEHVPGPAVCSQYFFLIRLLPHCSMQLLPGFLAWQINQEPAQEYLHRNAEGSDQLSIRRGILEALPLSVPPLERQQQILALAAAHKREQGLLEELRKNREREMQGIVRRLLLAQA